MKLGYITNGLAHHMLDDALELIADIGYRGVGLTLDVGHLNPFTAAAAEVARVGGRCRALGLAVSIETGARFLLDPGKKHEPTLITPDPDGRARRIDFYRRAVAIAAELGAGVLSLWSGVDHAGAPDAPAWLREGLGRTADLAARADVKVAFEPEPGMLLETVSDAAALVEELDHPALGLTVDVGHCVVLGEDVAVSLRRAGNRLLNVHLDDSMPGVHEHLPFGQGRLELGAVFGALSEIGYDGPANVELSRHSHAAPSAARAAYRALAPFLEAESPEPSRGAEGCP